MRLYLDEMISPRVARELRSRGHDAVAVADRDGLGEPDARQLAVAIREGRALVTHDVRDFAVLAKALATAGRHHHGIVFVSPRTFPPSDLGRLIDALDRLATDRRGDDALSDRVLFLPLTRRGGGTRRR